MLTTPTRSHRLRHLRHLSLRLPECMATRSGPSIGVVPSEPRPRRLRCRHPATRHRRTCTIHVHREGVGGGIDTVPGRMPLLAALVVEQGLQERGRRKQHEYHTCQTRASRNRSLTSMMTEWLPGIAHTSSILYSAPALCSLTVVVGLLTSIPLIRHLQRDLCHVWMLNSTGDSCSRQFQLHPRIQCSMHTRLVDSLSSAAASGRS